MRLARVEIMGGVYGSAMVRRPAKVGDALTDGKDGILRRSKPGEVVDGILVGFECSAPDGCMEVSDELAERGK